MISSSEPRRDLKNVRGSGPTRMPLRLISPRPCELASRDLPFRLEDPEKRFSATVDMRGPLLQIVDRAHAAVLDDLPKGFALKEGQVQTDTPTLPARVLWEAIVNALMHRSYREYRPTQIIRYANRIEITNAGYSLKNEDHLGEAGSQLRNPNLAAVFHETNTAETKGSGIRVMREQMRESGFSLPTFESNRANNTFTIRLLLHHFLREEDLLWLHHTPYDLNEPQRYALIFVREQGAIDNQTLHKLREWELLRQMDKGSTTHYLAGQNFPEAIEEHTTLRDDQAHGGKWRSGIPLPRYGETPPAGLFGYGERIKLSPYYFISTH